MGGPDPCVLADQRRAVETTGPFEVSDTVSSLGTRVDTEPLDDCAAMRTSLALFS